MVTYVVVVVVVAAVLYLSFRALGGGAPVAAEDYRTVLARLLEFTSLRAGEIGDAVAGAAPDAPAAEVAAGARKKLTGYQEQLTRLELSAEGAERDVLESARAFLSAAIEDLGWACRMLEAGNHADNPGVQRAVAELRSAAAECLDAAGRLVGTPAEPAAVP